eukprot:gene12317-biopygen36921
MAQPDLGSIVTHGGGGQVKAAVWQTARPNADLGSIRAGEETGRLPERKKGGRAQRCARHPNICPWNMVHVPCDGSIPLAPVTSTRIGAAAAAAPAIARRPRTAIRSRWKRGAPPAPPRPAGAARICWGWSRRPEPPSSAPPDWTWSTPVVNVRSAAMHKHSRPVSSIVPFRPITCTKSPASFAAVGSGSPSDHDFHSGVQMLPGLTMFTRTPFAASSTASGRGGGRGAGHGSGRCRAMNGSPRVHAYETVSALPETSGTVSPGSAYMVPKAHRADKMRQSDTTPQPARGAARRRRDPPRSHHTFDGDGGDD